MTLAITRERTNLDLHTKLIKKAEDLIPVLKERSESANADRRIPKDTSKTTEVSKEIHKASY